MKASACKYVYGNPRSEQSRMCGARSFANMCNFRFRVYTECERTSERAEPCRDCAVSRAHTRPSHNTTIFPPAPAVRVIRPSVLGPRVFAVRLSPDPFSNLRISVAVIRRPVGRWVPPFACRLSYGASLPRAVERPGTVPHASAAVYAVPAGLCAVSFAQFCFCPYHRRIAGWSCVHTSGRRARRPHGNFM